MTSIIGAAIAFAIAGAVASEVTYVVNKKMDHSAEDAAALEKAVEEFRKAEAEHTKQRETQLDWLNEQIRMETHAEVLNTKRLTRLWKPTTRQLGVIGRKWPLSLL
jgi:demethoxyubiquinone hydroxylase (CLK1/Coq7/Cat5 family)